MARLSERAQVPGGDSEVNIIKRIVKETVLVPYRVLQGLGAALDEIADSVEEFVDKTGKPK